MRLVVVGIAGGTGSGKSTISRGITAALGDRCLALSHDRYYRTLAGHFDPQSYSFDHPDSLETDLLLEHLDALLAGQEVVLPRYDFATHTRETGGDRVAPRPVLLVEGILVLSDPGLRERFDLSIFVHAPADVRLARRIHRDTTERGRPRAEILEQWEATVHPMHLAYVEPSRAHADLDLDGTADIAANVALALSAIEQELRAES